jgi:hypothetical protein
LKSSKDTDGLTRSAESLTGGKKERSLVVNKTALGVKVRKTKGFTGFNFACK